MTNTPASRGVVRGGVVLLATPLSEGTEVLVTPLATPRSSGALVTAAADDAVKVPIEWVDELEGLIAQGQRPPSAPVSFDDETDGKRTG